MSLTRSEVARKLTHIAAGGFALALPYLTWPQAAAMAAGAFAFNAFLFPRIGGKGTWRAAEHERGYPLGILIYPLSVLALILVFRHELWKAAGVWGVLALGDGMASIVGQAMGGPRLPWNERKGWAGSLAMLVFGALGCAGFIAWTRGGPIDASLVALSLVVAAACAWAESLPTTLDDNFTVPLVGALAIALAAQADLARLAPGTAKLALLGLALNAAIALAAYAARSIDVAGALSAIAIGTLIVAGLGLGAFALMIAFFIVGTAMTKMGYRIKAARGIAQEKGGRRGWRNAWANGGVPALLAAFGALAPEALRPAFLLAYAASVATAAADTCSSEIGKAYGRRTFLITTFKPVPPGTEGAVSLEGTLGAVLGAGVVGALGAALGLYSWIPALLVTAAGVLGSLAESVVGTVAEKRGWMGNDLLNAFNTAVGAAIAVGLLRIVR